MQPKDFIFAYAPAAMQAQIQFGIPASITLAQAALESGWGKYAPGFNFFGIKADAKYSGPYVSADTSEYINNQWIKISAKFRKYDSPIASFKDHAGFLKNNSRYSPLFKLDSSDSQGWATGLQKFGYATDPNYASKIMSIVNAYNLEQYNQEAKKKSTPSL